MTTSEKLELEGLKQEQRMHEENIVLYRATADRRLEKSEERQAAIMARRVELEKSEPLNPQLSTLNSPEK